MLKGAFGTLFEAIKGGTAADILGGIGEVMGGIFRFLISIPYSIMMGLVYSWN